MSIPRALVSAEVLVYNDANDARCK